MEDSTILNQDNNEDIGGIFNCLFPGSQSWIIPLFSARMEKDDSIILYSRMELEDLLFFTLFSTRIKLEDSIIFNQDKDGRLDYSHPGWRWGPPLISTMMKLKIPIFLTRITMEDFVVLIQDEDRRFHYSQQGWRWKISLISSRIKTEDSIFLSQVEEEEALNPQNFLFKCCHLATGGRSFSSR